MSVDDEMVITPRQSELTLRRLQAGVEAYWQNLMEEACGIISDAKATIDAKPTSWIVPIKRP